mmetsp:Transcript_13948/g.20605  ORF Transcript_13948/g.20605 Transcript_13948/m.20605 type:complete len:233 (-) Transcript_13948:984-1682(-)
MRTEEKNDSSTKPSLEDQLDKAEAVVLRGRDTTHQLHVWWRKYLFLISLLILFFSFHQAKIPGKECMKAAEIINPEIIQHTSIFIKDSAVEIMGLIMIGLLSTFVSRGGPMKFFDPSYIFATILVPAQIVTFFNNRKIGCQDLIDSETYETLPTLDRPFPISLVLHTVVTLSCLFMKYQMDARNKDVQAVRDLRKDLAEAQRTNKENGRGKRESSLNKNSNSKHIGDSKKKK